VDAKEMLDHQADLIVRLQQPMLRRAWQHQMALDMGFDNPASWGGVSQEDSLRRINAAAAGGLDTMTATIREATPYFVTPDMTRLVTYAASQLEDLDRIDRKIVPSASGLVRFEGGIPFRDVRGATLILNWVLWGPVTTVNRNVIGGGEPTEAIAVWAFNDHYTNPDQIAERLVEEIPDEIRALYGRWGFAFAEFLYDQQRLGPAWRIPPEEYTQQIVESGGVPVEFSNIARFMHAFWLLLGQKVTISEPAHLDRPRRKRAERAGLPARVTVIRLRAAETRQHPGESLVDWSHRWVVKGHWRWYHCGPNHPQAQEISPGEYMCRLWIAPFIKGPADKPLVITEHVYKLER
jgi:hypothetical protein